MVTMVIRVVDGVHSRLQSMVNEWLRMVKRVANGWVNPYDGPISHIATILLIDGFSDNGLVVAIWQQ